MNSVVTFDGDDENNIPADIGRSASMSGRRHYGKVVYDSINYSRPFICPAKHTLDMTMKMNQQQEDQSNSEVIPHPDLYVCPSVCYKR